MRNVKIMVCTTVMVLLMGVPAFAFFTAPTVTTAFTGGSLDNYRYASNMSDYLHSTGTYNVGWHETKNNVPSGQYDVTFAFRSAFFYSTWEASSGGSLSNVGDMLSGVELQDSNFKTSWGLFISTYSINNNNHVRIFEVLKDFSASNIDFTAGDYFIGFDDIGGGDFDDMIFKASVSSATPIPGAIWLLGSGLVGLVGLRRKIA